jgi:hypothetical protein
MLRDRVVVVRERKVRSVRMRVRRAHMFAGWLVEMALVVVDMEVTW